MKIKPCPFCGETEDLEVGIENEDREGVPTYIYCGTCGAHGPWNYIEHLPSQPTIDFYAEATHWNDRKIND